MRGSHLHVVGLQDLAEVVGDDAALVHTTLERRQVRHLTHTASSIASSYLTARHPFHEARYVG